MTHLIDGVRVRYARDAAEGEVQCCGHHGCAHAPAQRQGQHSVRDELYEKHVPDELGRGREPETLAQKPCSEHETDELWKTLAKCGEN